MDKYAETHDVITMLQDQLTMHLPTMKYTQQITLPKYAQSEINTILNPIGTQLPYDGPHNTRPLRGHLYGSRGYFDVKIIKHAEEERNELQIFIKGSTKPGGRSNNTLHQQDILAAVLMCNTLCSSSSSSTSCDISLLSPSSITIHAQNISPDLTVNAIEQKLILSYNARDDKCSRRSTPFVPVKLTISPLNNKQTITEICPKFIDTGNCGLLLPEL